MATTLTTRLNMIKPTPGSDETYNIAQANGNMDKIDAAIGATICTSGTRPPSPWDGQFIRETDTGRLYMRSASIATWLLVMDPGAWNTYTPVFSTSAGTPNVGNGLLTGRYQVIGKSGHVKIAFTVGTTTNVGTNNWRFSLPFTPAVDGVLTAWVEDSSAATRIPGAARIIAASSGGDNMRISVGTGVTVTSGGPVTWADQDRVILAGTLELA